MKRCKQMVYSLFPMIGVIILILDAKTSFRGAADGIALCMKTVIPALFPFFILSAMLTSSLIGRKIPIINKLGKFCGIPSGAESLLLIGLIGGYPVGARVVTQAYQNGQISKHDGRRMLGFCSNAGPAFLFGMLSPLFPKQWMLWGLWSIHIASALITGHLLPGKAENKVSLTVSKPLGVQKALDQSMRALAGVCGWVVVFRIILSFLDRWLFWLIPNELATILSGVLELTNGCIDLAKITDISLRGYIATGFLGWGGICVVMQTVSVTGTLGLGYYIPGKIMQTALSVLICSLFLFFQKTNALILVIPVISAIIISTILLVMKKRSRNYTAAVV